MSHRYPQPEILNGPGFHFYLLHHHWIPSFLCRSQFCAWWRSRFFSTGKKNFLQGKPLSNLSPPRRAPTGQPPLPSSPMLSLASVTSTWRTTTPTSGVTSTAGESACSLCSRRSGQRPCLSACAHRGAHHHTVQVPLQTHSHTLLPRQRKLHSFWGLAYPTLSVSCSHVANRVTL